MGRVLVYKMLSGFGGQFGREISNRPTASASPISLTAFPFTSCVGRSTSTLSETWLPYLQNRNYIFTASQELSWKRKRTTYLKVFCPSQWSIHSQAAMAEAKIQQLLWFLSLSPSPTTSNHQQVHSPLLSEHILYPLFISTGPTPMQGYYTSLISELTDTHWPH